MNIVILQGNVGEDPRIKDFENGGKVAQFSLATTERGFKTQDGRDIPDKTTWHNIVVKKSGLAGVCQQFVKKGSPLLVKGSIESRQYDDANGVTRTIVEIIVDDLTLLQKREREQAPAPAPQPSRAPQYQQPYSPNPGGVSPNPAHYQGGYAPTPNGGQRPLFDENGDMPDFYGGR